MYVRDTPVESYAITWPATIEMTNGWIVELQALSGPNVDLLDQITAVLVGKIGLGD